MQIILSDFQDQLVKGLSHRMNNILTLFHGYLGLLLDNEKLDPVTLEGLAKIKDGARIATELMDRTNAFVRPSNLAPREISVGEFLNQLSPSFAKIRGNGPQIEVECAEELPSAWADPSRLRLALTEIVKNACDATELGGTVKITIAKATTEPGKNPFPGSDETSKDWIVISVTDSGSGIPKEIEAQIYEPFATTKKRQSIAGLGLPVAMGCMQQIGGSIEHESTATGTTFRLLIPARDSSELRAVA